MALYDGVANGFLRFDKREKKYFFTESGLSQLKEMVQVGCSINEVADFFVVDEDFIREAVDKDGQAYDVFRHASALFRMTLRQAQLSLSPKSASMARHLGHHALGQPVDPTPREDGLEKRVVGTMPNWEDDPSDWVKQFKPKDGGASTIDKLKAMRQEQERAETEASEDKENDGAE